MPSNDSQQIVALISKIAKRRKKIVALSVVGLLIPVIFYNEMATPTYEAATSLVFEEFSNSISKYGYDLSREILIQNRLEEIKSLSFAEDIATALPSEYYGKFNLRDDAPPDFDKFGYISMKINRKIVAYAIRGSNVIQIGFESSDPALCREVANTAAQVFQQRISRVRQEGVSGVRTFIEEQLMRVQEQLNDSEQELKAFKEANNIISVDRESQGLLKTMTEAEVLYNQVKSNRGSVEERLVTVETKLRQQKETLVPSIMDIATPYTQRLKEKLISLQQQVTELKLSGYEDDHPKLAQLERETEQTKKSLAAEALKIAKGESIIDPIAQIEKYVNEVYTLQIELETLKAQENMLKETMKKYEGKMRSLPEKEYVLARLTRQKEVMAQSYMMLLQKREEARISEAENLTSIRVIDKARTPFIPISPRKKLNVAIGLFLGLLIGFGVAFIREVSATSLDSADELEKLTDWHVLASVPVISTAGNGRFPLLNRPSNGSSKSPLIKQGLITDGDASKSAIAETYRMLRTNLQFLGLGDKYKTILITSIGPDEGKTTTLTNLGATLAMMEQKVLLVDADLRRPQMHSIFDIDKEPGLTDLLVYHGAMKDDVPIVDGNQPLTEKGFKHQELGDLVDNFSDFVMDSHFLSKINNLAGISNLNMLNSSLVETVQSTYIENLKVLTSGKQLKNPSETVSSISMKALLDELKNKFNVVLIDSAPLLLVPETMVISSLVDGVIFVVDAQKYHQEMLVKAKSLLQQTNAKVIGVVINNVEIDRSSKSAYYYYSQE